jgi:thiol-disulfide isomerase/thioredoxin
MNTYNKTKYRSWFKAVGLSIFLFTLSVFQTSAQKNFFSHLTNEFYKNPFSVSTLPLSFQDSDFEWLNKKEYKSIFNAKCFLYTGDDQKYNFEKKADSVYLEVTLATSYLKSDTVFLISSGKIDSIQVIDCKKINDLWFKRYFRLEKPDIQIDLNIARNGKMVNLPIKIIIGLSEEASKIKRKYTFGTGFYKKGSIAISGSPFEFYVNNENRSKFTIGKSSAIKIKTNDTTNKFENYAFGDTILLNNQYFIFTGISKNEDKVFYKILKSRTAPVGFNVGFKHSEFEFEDIISGSIANTKMLLGQKEFLLLDFWGTWCGPCIAGIPDLIKFNEKYKDFVNIVSIASEKKVDSLKLRSDIVKYGLSWHNLLQQNASFGFKGSILSNYRVTAYPTYILIDRRGLIVSRQVGFLDIDKIALYIDKSGKTNPKSIHIQDNK